MTLVRFDPFRDLRALHRRVDRVFNETVARRADESTDEPLQPRWVPVVDVHESGKEITLRTELPGLTDEDIELTVDQGRLTVQGEKKFEKEESDGEYRRVESRYGTFYRSFPLPDSIDQDNIAAHFDNGVLNVTLPKTESAKPKKIDVQITSSTRGGRSQHRSPCSTGPAPVGDP